MSASQKCLTRRCLEAILFAGFVLYCHVALHVYRKLDHLNLGRRLDDVDADDVTPSRHVTARVASGASHRLWPRSESDTTERILDQLEFAGERAGWSAGGRTRLVFVDGVNKQRRKGRDLFVGDGCPIDSCYVIYEGSAEHNGSATYDALLYSGPSPPDASVRLRPDGVRIWFSLESPLNVASPRRDVNWTATYRRASTLRAPYELFVRSGNRSAPRAARNYARGKSRLAAIFISNCRAKNNRTQYVDELRRHLAVDVYGACGALQCPRTESKMCFENMSRTYKFYLAFENSNCRDYITEKFFVNGLSNDVVPVVMGAHPDDYRAVAPPHSYIHVDDFESPRHLADYLKKLDQNDTLYNEYFAWKGTGTFINTKFWCRLCAMLHARDRTNYVHTYTDLTKWWHQDQCILPNSPYGATWRKTSNQTKT